MSTAEILWLFFAVTSVILILVFTVLGVVIRSRSRITGAYKDLEEKSEQLKERNIQLEGANKQIEIERDQEKRTRILLSNILNKSASLIIVLDSDLKITYFNNPCQQLSGYKESEVVGRSPKELEFMVFANPKPSVLGEHLIDSMGDSHIISWSYETISDKSGNLDYVVCTGEDVTLLKEAHDLIFQSRSRIKWEPFSRFRRKISRLYDFTVD